MTAKPKRCLALSPLGWVLLFALIMILSLPPILSYRRIEEIPLKTQIVNPRLLVTSISSDPGYIGAFINIKWIRPALLDQNGTITLRNLGERDTIACIHNVSQDIYYKIRKDKDTVIAHGLLKAAVGYRCIDIRTEFKTTDTVRELIDLNRHPVKAEMKILFEKEQNQRDLEKTPVVKTVGR